CLHKCLQIRRHPCLLVDVPHFFGRTLVLSLLELELVFAPGPYQRWSMASFHYDALLSSCVHGEAAPGTFQQELNDAISLFVGATLPRGRSCMPPERPVSQSRCARFTHLAG